MEAELTNEERKEIQAKDNHLEYLGKHDRTYTEEMRKADVPLGFGIDYRALFDGRLPSEYFFDGQNISPVSPNPKKGLFRAISTLFDPEIRNASNIMKEAQNLLGTSHIMGIVVKDVVQDREEYHFRFVSYDDLWTDPDTLRQKLVSLDDARFEMEEKDDTSIKLFYRFEAEKLALRILTGKY